MSWIGQDEGELWTAGQLAPAGRYRRVDVAAGRTVVLDRPDYLPASLDGRVALYQQPVASPVVARGRLATVSA